MHEQEHPELELKDDHRDDPTGRLRLPTAFDITYGLALGDFVVLRNFYLECFGFRFPREET